VHPDRAGGVIPGPDTERRSVVLAPGMRRKLAVLLTIAGCRPEPAASTPPSTEPAPAAEAPAAEAPAAVDAIAALPAEVREAVQRAIDARFVPEAGKDPMDAWTADMIPWSMKQKRPLNDAALLALDGAFRAAADDAGRQLVVLATAQFYGHLAAETEGYRQQVQALMTSGVEAPDLAATYRTSARQYYEACANAVGPHVQACRDGLAAVQDPAAP
jgi:hypothetical protein